MLEIRNINVHYGVIHALKNISMKVEEGEIVTLIGANGAGKTTTLRAISGIKKLTDGEIFLGDKSLTKVTAQEIVKLGLSQVPEGRRIFQEMTVVENLELGAFLLRDKDGIQQAMKGVYERFPILFFL